MFICRRARLLKEFALYDTDGDGHISKDEFKAMLDDKGYSEEAKLTLMKGFDTAKEGYWTFDEFKKFINFQ